MVTERAEAAVTPTATGRRRIPTQARSRRKVEQLLDTAARLVVERGVDSLTTREIAVASGVPVASLYQYFADKEEVLLALAERDMAEMDAQVLRDLSELRVLTLSGLVRTTMEAFVSVYRRRRAFVEIYLRGRSNAAVHQFGREHNTRVARMLRDFAIDQGLAEPTMPEASATLAVEIGDRVFQLAYEHDDDGDRELVEEGIVLVTAYLERYATAAGLAGTTR